MKWSPRARKDDLYVDNGNKNLYVAYKVPNLGEVLDDEHDDLCLVLQQASLRLATQVDYDTSWNKYVNSNSNKNNNNNNKDSNSSINNSIKSCPSNTRNEKVRCCNGDCSQIDRDYINFWDSFQDFVNKQKEMKQEEKEEEKSFPPPVLGENSSLQSCQETDEPSKKAEPSTEEELLENRRRKLPGNCPSSTIADNIRLTKRASFSSNLLQLEFVQRQLDSRKKTGNVP